MKRDMPLVRKILLHIEDRNNVRAERVEIDGYDDELVQRHVELLLDAGFIQGLKSHTISQSLPVMRVTDLTWEGHDFLAAMRNEGVWARIKSSFDAAELAGMPLEVIREIGVGLLKEYAKSKIGLSS